MACHWFLDNLPLLGVVGLQFSYASTALLAKEVMTQGVRPMVFVTYRELASALFLVPTTLIARRGKRNPAMGMKGFGLVFLAALVGVTCSQVLYYQGLKFTSASVASAVGNTVPAITFLLAASLGLEKMEIRNSRSMAKVLGTITCVSGAILMALFKGKSLLNMEFHTLEHFFCTLGGNWMIGCLLILGTSSCWSICFILQVPINEHYLDPLSFSTWMCSLGFIQSAIITFFLEHELRPWEISSYFVLLCALYAGIVGSGVTYYIQSWVVSRKGPVFTATFQPLSTIIVTIIDSLFLHEELYIGSLIGAAAILVGLYIVLWGKATDFNKKEESYPRETYRRTNISIDDESTKSSDVKEPLLDI